MHIRIAAKVPELRNTRIICRSGDPTDLYDLAIVNPQASRSIIIVSPDGDDPDSQVVKSVLALVTDVDTSQSTKSSGRRGRWGRYFRTIGTPPVCNEARMVLRKSTCAWRLRPFSS